jgi:Glycosyltransferase family 87
MERASAHPMPQRLVTAFALLLILTGCLIGIVVPAGLGWDFGNFYEAGRLVATNQAEDLYRPERAAGAPPSVGHMRFWSAPLSAAFLAPLSLMQPTTALVVFKIENTIALCLGLALLYLHSRRFVDPAHRWDFAAAFATLALLYQPFWTIFRVGGQTTPTVFLLLVITLLCHTKSRLLASASLLVIAAMIKPTLAVLCVFLACVAGSSFVIALFVALAVGGLLSVTVMGWAVHQQFLKVLAEGSQMLRPWVYNSSLYVPFENLRLLQPNGPWNSSLVILEWILRIIVVSTFIVIIRRSRNEHWSTAARRHFEFLMAICFWLLTSQLLWEHYLAALFLPLAYFVAMHEVFSPRARMLIAAIFVMAVGQNLILVQYIATRFQINSIPGLITAGALKAAPLILLLVILFRHHREVFAIYRSPAWMTLGGSPRLTSESAVGRTGRRFWLPIAPAPNKR